MLEKTTFNGWGVIRFCLQVTFDLVELAIRPWVGSLSMLLSLYNPLTTETPTKVKVRKVTLTLPYLLLHISTIPLATVAGGVRLVLQIMRHNYIYLHHRNSYNSSPSPKGDYSIASINTCLLPDAASRYNNLDQTHRRAKQIGERIVVDQFFYGDKQLSSSNHRTNIKIKNNQIQKSEDYIDAEVVPHFPELDFLCFQEVWQRHYARPLISELKKVYPYIVYDIGHWSWGCNYFVYNSGLLFASRYEILEFDFKPFKHKCLFCVINSKGLAMIKVLLKERSHPGGRREVGYIFATHLQAYQGEKKVVDKQMDEIVAWTKEFREKTKCNHDNVKLDCLCGDFNFDNMSPCDKELYMHPLFDLYNDPCRERAGRDKSWAVGTEMRQDMLWETQASTPTGLCSALKDHILRQQFIVDSDLTISSVESIVNTKPKTDAHGNIIPSPMGGRRRVDYVLHRKNMTKVKKYRFVTSLATLTDHIPVTMTIEPDS